MDATLIDLSKMSRSEKYRLACQIITDIDREWEESSDKTRWEEENIEEYSCKMAFEELACEVRAVRFRS